MSEKWAIHKNRIVNSAGKTLADTRYSHCWDEQRNLMVAAPDLLDALKALREAAPVGSGNDYVLDNAVRVAEVAIAKAEGRA